MVKPKCTRLYTSLWALTQCLMIWQANANGQNIFPLHFFIQAHEIPVLLMEEILHHFQRPTVETSRSQFNIVWRHSDQNGFVRVTEILHHLSACHSTLSLGVRGCKLCIGKCMVVEVVQDFLHPPKKEKDSLYFWSRTIFPATSYFHRIKPIIGSNRFFSQ